MKKHFITILLFAASYCHAQNYQCLQAGVRRYFINANGYLRGMRIDSVKSSGSELVYYPFHTERGSYKDIVRPGILDSTGASWLGKRVIQQSDGTFLFDNIWSDTVIINTQAHTADTWLFYNDTTSQYYTATVTAEDTMTIMGSTDSVKKISINAFGKAGADPKDLADNFQIILSKDHGFASAFDLYTFPYHKPNTVYGPGMDYYLDYLMDEVRELFPMPTTTVSVIFNLVDLVNPSYDQLFDWHAGDVFENKVFYGATEGLYPQAYYLDSIISGTPVTGGTLYKYTGWTANEHFPWSYYHGSSDPGYTYPYDTVSVPGTFIMSNQLLLDTTLMPEENGQKWLQYYLPGDTANCRAAAGYKLLESNIKNHQYSATFEASGVYRYYKSGLGLVHYDWNILGGSPPGMEDTSIIYYSKSGVTCGERYTSFPINDLLSVATIKDAIIAMHPNPATDEVTITATENITHVQITNTIGQVVFDNKCNNKKITVNTANFSAGIYFVRINDNTVRKLIKQ